MKTDFFISYKASDDTDIHEANWAVWVAQVLGEAGYTTKLQERDYRPGQNFVLEMHQALETCSQIILLLSEAYLQQSAFGSAEWAAKFAEDPTGEKRLLIPVMVKACSPTGLLRPIVHRSLVGLTDQGARAALLDAVSDNPKLRSVPFPGGLTRASGRRIDSTQAIESLQRAHITRFHLSRSDYAQTLREYLELAETSISLVSIYLTSKGGENDLIELFRTKLQSHSKFFLTVSLLDYRQAAVAPAAQTLGMTPERLQAEIRNMFESLLGLRRELDPSARRRFEILAHPTLPPASVVLLDENHSGGRIQIETRLYRSPGSESYGYEIVPGSTFYDRHVSAFRRLIEDSRDIADDEFDGS